jgi:hypothetical protein
VAGQGRRHRALPGAGRRQREQRRPPRPGGLDRPPGTHARSGELGGAHGPRARITDVSAGPATPAADEPVTVSATVPGQTSATLRYRTDFAAEQTVAMTPAGGDVYTATVPGVAAGHLLRYPTPTTTPSWPTRPPTSAAPPSWRTAEPSTTTSWSASAAKARRTSRSRTGSSRWPTGHRQRAFTLPAGNYRFEVVAINAVGTGAASARSANVTPGVDTPTRPFRPGPFARDGRQWYRGALDDWRADRRPRWGPAVQGGVGGASARAGGVTCAPPAWVDHHPLLDHGSSHSGLVSPTCPSTSWQEDGP